VAQRLETLHSRALHLFELQAAVPRVAMELQPLAARLGSSVPQLVHQEYR
jgi:hypothetical protein